MKNIVYLFLLCATGSKVFANDSLFRFNAGLSYKKFAGFYTMTGLCAEFSHKQIAKNKLYFGLNVTSSLLGSAFNNNGIPVLATELYARYPFRHEKKLQPFVMLNTGYAKANYGSDKYKNLTSSSFILSPEAGISYKLPYNIQLQGSLAYQLISGDGINGPGFIYPVCFQMRAYMCIK